MRSFRLNLRRPRTQLHLAAFIFLFMLAAAPSVAHGMGLRFWDDANSNGGQCDVLGYLGGSTKCDDNSYNVALVSTMTAPVPKGPTTVHIVYDNLPLKADGSIDGSAGLFANDNLHFDIQGDQWCPTYSGAAGVNRKDAATAGDFATANDLPTGLSGAAEVTDFVINRPDGTERDLAGGTYRTSSTYCDTSGSNYTMVVTVKPADLQHQRGFPPGTWYVEMLARPSETLIANGTNQAAKCGTKYYNSDCSIRCSGGSPNNCQGITNKFRVLLNTSETGSSYYHSVSGSSISATGNDFNVTFTNQNTDWYSGIAGDGGSSHYGIVYRFGADCSVLNSNGALATKVLFYDIDDSGNSGDIQKALLVRVDKDGNLYTLGSGGYAVGKSAAPGVWHSVGSNWSQSYDDPDTTRIDSGTNTYVSANFNARVGDKYRLYIYDIRMDLVDQIGAPFDSVYYDNPCTAKLNPGVSLGLGSGFTKYAPGSQVIANATIDNPDNTAATADWVREYCITPVQANPDTSFGAGDTRIHAQGTGTRKVYSGNTADSTDGSAFGGPWTYTIPANAADGSWICTSLYLNPNTLDPPNTDIVGASNPAVTCKRISNNAQPYFSAIGGDVAVGAGFGSCSPHTPASGTSIYANNQPTSPYNGASSQLAALTLGLIKGFTTGKYQNNQTGTTWYDALSAAAGGAELSFANTNLNGNFGTNAGFTSWCAPDYYAAYNAPPGGHTKQAVTSPASVATLSTNNKVYTYTGNLTVNAANVPADGRDITLLVNGNVYINSGSCTAIIYGSSCAGGAAASLANIPIFRIIASGSIYVDQSVTELDGMYVAQGGNFITCANGFTGMSGTSAIAGCNKQLKIYGAVAAGKAVVPNRTLGDFAGAAGQTESPAEFFYYNPQMWLTGGDTSGGGVGSWQAVTSLPPIL
jgi:hypothetical protein